MGVSGQSHAPAALYPRGKEPRYPLDRRLGGPRSRSGRRGFCGLYEIPLSVNYHVFEIYTGGNCPKLFNC
jgi:hypothetical protein